MEVGQDQCPFIHSLHLYEHAQALRLQLRGMYTEDWIFLIVTKDWNTLF